MSKGEDLFKKLYPMSITDQANLIVETLILILKPSDLYGLQVKVLIPDGDDSLNFTSKMASVNTRVIDKNNIDYKKRLARYTKGTYPTHPDNAQAKKCTWVTVKKNYLVSSKLGKGQGHKHKTTYNYGYRRYGNGGVKNKQYITLEEVDASAVIAGALKLVLFLRPDEYKTPDLEAMLDHYITCSALGSVVKFQKEITDDVTSIPISPAI